LIDWKTAGVGNPGVDLGELRKQVAISYGEKVPVYVLEGWERASGVRAENVPYWDATAALNTPTESESPTAERRRDAFLVPRSRSCDPAAKEDRQSWRRRARTHEHCRKTSASCTPGPPRATLDRPGPKSSSGRRRGRARLNELGDSADLGNDSLLDAVTEHLRNDALRSDIFHGFDRRLLPKRSSNMTTDTSTLPRRALVERDDPATPTRRESPLRTERRPAARRPRTKRGGGHLLRLLLPDESRHPASDPLLLLGPNGGPLWTSRTH
jgi:hypothetical protein